MTDSPFFGQRLSCIAALIPADAGADCPDGPTKTGRYSW